MSNWGVNAGYGWGSGTGASQVRYRGDNAGLGAGGPLNTLMFQGLNDYFNSGALSDMLLGGGGFGQSRRFRQYNPYDENYGYLQRHGGGGGNRGAAYNPNAGDGDDGDGGAGAGDGRGPGPIGAENPGPRPNGAAITGGDPSMTASVEGGASGTYTLPNGRTVTPRVLGPGQRDPNEWYDPEDPYGEGQYGDWNTGQGNDRGPNQYWGSYDDAPVEGQGLLGAIQGYGKNPTEIDKRLAHDLGWQATGDLMDLEAKEKGMWEQFGEKNQNEAAVDNTANWFRGGELSSLEQEGKLGWNQFKDPTALENEVGNSWRGVSGPGQYDALRGETATGMVKSTGFSPKERASMLGSSLLPIQQQLEAQKLEGDARQAATGNAAGRWGASNAMALDAAGKAAQAGRDIEMGSAATARQDRLQGLNELGGLQGQIDARKVQGAQGLQNLSGQQRQAALASVQGLNQMAQNQRQNQLSGMSALMQSNDQQRGAQAQAAQGIGGLGQRQRQNTQWGLSALGEQNAAQKNDQLTGIGLQKDMWNSLNQKGQAGANLAAGIGSLAAGSQDKTGQSGGNVGVSV